MTAETKHHFNWTTMERPQKQSRPHIGNRFGHVWPMTMPGHSPTCFIKVRMMKFEVHHKIQRSNYHPFFHIIPWLDFLPAIVTYAVAREGLGSLSESDPLWVPAMEKPSPAWSLKFVLFSRPKCWLFFDFSDFFGFCWGKVPKLVWTEPLGLWWTSGGFR